MYRDGSFHSHAGACSSLSGSLHFVNVAQNTWPRGCTLLSLNWQPEEVTGLSAFGHLFGKLVRQLFALLGHTQLVCVVKKSLSSSLCVLRSKRAGCTFSNFNEGAAATPLPRRQAESTHLDIDNDNENAINSDNDNDNDNGNDHDGENHKDDNIDDSNDNDDHENAVPDSLFRRTQWSSPRQSWRKKSLDFSERSHV